MADKPFRLLPKVTDENRHYWSGGESGELRFLRCGDDGTLIHPPAPVCPVCLGRNLAPHTVSGRATLHSFTVNHQPWNPLMPPPYVIALVEIDEQPSVRLMTNIVNIPVDEVEIGMPVQVLFEHHSDGRGDDVWIPLFEPVREEANS